MDERVLVSPVLQADVGSSSRTRIFYGDSSQTMVDQNTDYSARIEVASDPRATRLIIPEAALSDEKDFFCQVNGLVAGSVEGKTHLRVFGQSALTPNPNLNPTQYPNLKPTQAQTQT